MAIDFSKYTVKGGTILGIAATSHAKGISHWNALGPALLNPVAGLVRHLDSSQEVVALTTAVRHTIQGDFASIVPDWVVRLIKDSPLLERVGNEVTHYWPPDSTHIAPVGRAGGQSALAVAICRNTDLAKAVTDLFALSEQSQFWDLVSLAAVLSPPGTPSALRKQIKSIVNFQL